MRCLYLAHSNWQGLPIIHSNIAESLLRKAAVREAAAVRAATACAAGLAVARRLDIANRHCRPRKPTS